MTTEPLPPEPGSEVRLVDYDPLWPELFEAEAARLRAALGDCAIAVEHVGSTSVPGLCAKPVIDINLAIADPAEEAAYRRCLEAAGYAFRHRDPAWFEHRLFRRETPRVNLHVFTAGCPELARMRLFRDWLRHSSEDRELYARTKLALAARGWRTVQDYADAKTGVVGEIAARAEAWRDGIKSSG